MDNDNRQCNKCGLRPQQPAKPKVCGCKPKRCCKKKDCCNDNEFAFRKVVIPSALGDDVTGQAKPENGNYTNSYVEYEINGAQYMYDSFGVYTKMEGGKGGGVSDFNDLDNRPKYAGAAMTGETDIPDVDVAVAGLQTQINGKQNTLTQTQLDAVNSGIDTTKVNQIVTNTSEVATIEGKIPTQASSSNQLADKNFVNSSIATNTAYYISDNGQPFQSLADLEAYSGTLTNNDYAFVVGTDAQGNTVYDRYKYNASTQQWAFEYELNNSSFTAVQWAAINSGITSGDVTKLVGLADIRSIGNNLTLDPATSTLSATDTTYTDFVGTDGTSAGTAGLVPAPAVSDAGKYLKADGTWDSMSGGIPTDAAFWGQSYDATNNRVNGQIGIYNPGASKAAIYGLLPSQSSSIYTGAISFGYTSGEVNIGRQRASVPGNMNTSYAQFSDASVNFSRPLNMGWGGASKSRIYNLEDPTAAKDAANKQYVDGFCPVGTVYSSTSSTAPTFAGGTWTQIGTQTIGSSTIYYYERTA